MMPNFARCHLALVYNVYNAVVSPCESSSIIDGQTKPGHNEQTLWHSKQPGPRFNIATIFPGVWIPVIKIRWSWDCLIFMIGTPTLVRRHVYIETAPWFQIQTTAGFICNTSEWKPCHDDIIIWKHFPHYWPFVWGIHRSPVNSPHKGQWRGASMFSLLCALNKRLNKQLWGWWFEWVSEWLSLTAFLEQRTARSIWDTITLIMTSL